jgi:E3 ubiquitin-protein ligase SHPRH
MLNREEDISSTIVYTPLYSCHDLSENLFYIHIIYGLPVNINQMNSWKNEQYSLSGGILCDEMGLGKTMCVLLTSLLNKCPTSFLESNSTILSHSFNDTEEFPANKKFKIDDQLSLPCICGKIVKVSQKTENLIFTCSQCSRLIHKKCFIQDEMTEESFLCPYCEQRLVDHNQFLSTSATLIIAPASIIDQWIEEINKHLDCSLNVYMYEGIVNKIPVPDRRFLAKQDFIFCSYENLKKDIHHNEICTKEHHSTRTQIRKYEYLISPLLRLKFWRLGEFRFAFLLTF